MNKEILLLGCNYNHVDYRRIDYTSIISKLARYVKKNDIIPEEVSKLEDTNYDNILLALYKVALKSWTSNLNTVLIYYIGDSIDISEYISGYNSNYNINQGIVPTDYNIRKVESVINTDKIYEILSSFNPSTKVIFIADSCYTKSNILSLKYDWDIENKLLNNPSDIADLKVNNTLKNILVISFCLKNLSSNDDNFYNILDINKSVISIGDYIIKLRNLLDKKSEDKKNYDVFNILNDINDILTNKDVNMRVSLSSSYNLLKEREYLSVLDKQTDILDLSTYEDFINNSYVEIDNLPTFIDVPLVTTKSNINIPKVIKAPIVPKPPKNPIVPELQLNKPPPLIEQYTRYSNNDEYYDNRCSRSTFIESPRDYIQPIVPIGGYVQNLSQQRPIQHQQQIQQFMPQQYQPSQQRPQHQQYQQRPQQIQQFMHQPPQQYQPVYIESPRIQYPSSVQYSNQYQQPQKNVLKSTIVPKNTNQYYNKYYEPSNSYVQQCYC